MRGKNKKPRQAEKILLVLLDGHEATMGEIEATLNSQVEVYRISTYLWNLKTRGAEIKKIKVGRKIVAFQLLNVDTMTKYARDRGLIAPLPIALTAEDLMVAAG
jgi:hypothetical protein